MNLVDFQRLRGGLKLNAALASARVRKAFEAGLHEELLRTGLLTELEVGGTHHVDHLIVGLGSFANGIGEDQVVRAVEGAWGAIAFHHWQAHAFLVEGGHVELQAATLDRPGGHYVTLHLVAQRAEVPAGVSPVAAMPEQRSSSRDAASAPGMAHTA